MDARNSFTTSDYQQSLKLNKENCFITARLHWKTSGKSNNSDLVTSHRKQLLKYVKMQDGRAQINNNIVILVS